MTTLRHALYAGALGDALGAPHEGRPPVDDVRPPQTWRVSDDTLLTLASLEGCRQAGGDPAAIAAAYVDAFRETIPGLGASTLGALRSLAVGAHWALSGIPGERAAGNGAAMRMAPLAWFVDPRTRAGRRTIRDVARITHRNEEATTGALAFLLGLELRAGGVRGEALLDRVADALPDTVVRDRLDAYGAGTVPEGPVSGYAPDSVSFVLYLAAQPWTCIEDGLVAAVAQGGDTDTNASMLGQILGAAGVPFETDWARHLPLRGRLNVLTTGPTPRVPGRG